MASNMSSKFTKRAHKKSRNGCNTCKLRRVKCDETHPMCLNCSRRGTECVYSLPKLPGSKSDTGSSNDGSISGPRTLESMCELGIFASSFDVSKTQSVPLLEFSPAAHSDSSCTSTSSDILSMMQYQNYNNTNETPQQFDPDFVATTGSSFDSPNSIFGFNDKADLLISKNVIDVSTPSDLVDPQLKGLSLTLFSNSGEKEFPSYLDYTMINNKLLDYFSTVLSAKLAPDLEMARNWAALSTFGFRYTHLFHMAVSLSSLAVYYEVQEKNVDTVLNFEKAEKYLLIDQLNYQQYVVGSARSGPRPVLAAEVFSYLAAALLNLVRYLLSPTSTVCDPSFYKITATLCGVFDDLEAGGNEPECHKNVQATLAYYNPFSGKRLSFDSTSFFPIYLYDLCCWRPTEADLIHDATSIVELLENELEKNVDEIYGKDSDPVEKLSESEVTLRLAINLLRREYAMVYNDDSPEKDLLKVFSRWPSLVPNAFAELLGQHDPRCLVLVAHYLCLLSSVDNNHLLPTKAIVDELIKIESVLDDEWIPWLDVPKRVVGMI